MMKNKKVFVTVGTTKFEQLIDTVAQDDILNLLSDLGYSEIQFQTGKGTHTPKIHRTMNLSYDDYFDDFNGQIMSADLVISHAGAGTCLDVLRCGKPLIVVINELLMDNHQSELAEQLEKDEYLYQCDCGGLKEVLCKNVKALKRYPQPNGQAFSNYMNKCMGFVQS